MDDCDIFRDQLATTYPRYGHALWNPRPTRSDRPVEVGDVGFIRWGTFLRLFNALLPADDPSHELGLPEGYKPLVPSLPNHINRGPFSHGHYCSDEIRVESVPGYQDGPNDFPKLSFLRPGKQKGAVLFLPVDARRENTIAQGDFGKWLIEHIDHSFNFARRLGLGIEQREQIILVTGCDRATSWTNVAFLGNDDNARVSFGVGIVDPEGPNTSINFQFPPGNVQGAVLNHGPQGTDLPDNQCVFIRGFRVARTLRIFPKHLKAAADSAPDPEGDDGESDKDLVSIPAATQDPLQLLLSHTAERATDCDMVLIHDDDLQKIVTGRVESDTESSLDVLQPDVMINFFPRSNIAIHKFSYAISTSISSPNTDTIVVGRVAKISVMPQNPNLGWDVASESRWSPPSSLNTTPCLTRASSISSSPILTDSSPLLTILGDMSLSNKPARDEEPHNVLQREATHRKGGVGYGSESSQDSVLLGLQLDMEQGVHQLYQNPDRPRHDNVLHIAPQSLRLPPAPTNTSPHLTNELSTSSLPTPISISPLPIIIGDNSQLSDRYTRDTESHYAPPMTQTQPRPQPFFPEANPPGRGSSSSEYSRSYAPQDGDTFASLGNEVGHAGAYSQAPRSSWPQQGIGHGTSSGKHPTTSHIGRRKALFIGINYTVHPNPSFQLRHCVEDAHAIANFVHHNLDFERENICIMTDESHPWNFPTKENILREMRSLVHDAQPHDSLFFYFSGHSVQIKETSEDEVDGLDECICAMDYLGNDLYPDPDTPGLISDDVMHEILVKPLPSQCRLTAIFDSCDSGTFLDLPYLYDSNGVVESFRHPNRLHPDVVTLSTIKKDHETTQGGALRPALIRSVTASRNKITYEQLIRNVRESMKGYGFPQRPMLSSSHKIDTNVQFAI